MKRRDTLNRKSIGFGDTVAKAAKAVGVDGYFFEVHENPSAAWSDGSNMIKLDKFEKILKQLV